eukprot:jgi/Chlat1/4179/Chrsp27S04277
MPILYSAVARGRDVVLAEYAAAAGNANDVARKILQNTAAQNGDTRQSYSIERHIFHVLESDGLIFIAMADDTFGRRIPYAFLEEIRGRFTAMYGSGAQTALAYAMNDEFSRILAQQMDYFSTNPNADTINRVRGEISEVKNVLVQSIDKVLDRGEKISLLVDKTDSLQSEAFRFKRQARQMKHRMWIRNLRMMALLAIIVLVIVLGISAFACGGITFPNCR